MTGGAPLVKPARRGPKPKRPLKRSSKPIARKTRVPRVSKRPARQAELEADRKWSDQIHARGACEAKGYVPDETERIDMPHECLGQLQAAHGFRRGYLATRHDSRNGFLLCAAMHGWFGANPSSWKRFMIQKLGEKLYEELRLKAHGRTA